MGTGGAAGVAGEDWGGDGGEEEAVGNWEGGVLVVVAAAAGEDEEAQRASQRAGARVDGVGLRLLRLPAG